MYLVCANFSRSEHEDAPTNAVRSVGIIICVSFRAFNFVCADYLNSMSYLNEAVVIKSRQVSQISFTNGGWMQACQI